MNIPLFYLFYLNPYYFKQRRLCQKFFVCDYLVSGLRFFRHIHDTYVIFITACRFLYFRPVDYVCSFCCFCQTALRSFLVSAADEKQVEKLSAIKAALVFIRIISLISIFCIIKIFVIQKCILYCNYTAGKENAILINFLQECGKNHQSIIQN